METRVGYVTHYYNRIGVAVLVLFEALKVGDEVHFLGHTSDFTQKVWSMEIEHQKITSVGPGADVAVKVEEPVRKGDEVFKVTE